MGVYRVGKRVKTEEKENSSALPSSKKKASSVVKRALFRADKAKKKLKKHKEEEQDDGETKPKEVEVASQAMMVEEFTLMEEEDQEVLQERSVEGTSGVSVDPNLSNASAELFRTSSLEKGTGNQNEMIGKKDNSSATSSTLLNTEALDAFHYSGKGPKEESVEEGLPPATSSNSEQRISLHEGGEETVDKDDVREPTKQETEVRQLEEELKKEEGMHAEDANEHPSSPFSTLSSPLCREFLKWKALLTAPFMIFDPRKSAIVRNPMYDRSVAVRLSVLQGKCSALEGEATGRMLTPTEITPRPPSSSTNHSATSDGATNGESLGSSVSGVEHLAAAVYRVLEALEAEGFLPLSSADVARHSPVLGDGRPQPGARGITGSSDSSSCTTATASSSNHFHTTAAFTEERGKAGPQKFDASSQWQPPTRFAESILFTCHLLSSSSCRSLVEQLCQELPSSFAFSTSSLPCDPLSEISESNPVSGREKMKRSGSSVSPTISSTSVEEEGAKDGGRCNHEHDKRTGILLPSSEGGGAEKTNSAAILHWCSEVVQVIRRLQPLYQGIPSFREQHQPDHENELSAPSTESGSFSEEAAKETWRLWNQLCTLYNCQDIRSFLSSSSSSSLWRRQLSVVQEHMRGGTSTGCTPLPHNSRNRMTTSLLSSSSIGGGGKSVDGNVVVEEEERRAGTVLPFSSSSSSSLGVASRPRELLCHVVPDKSTSRVVVVFSRSSTQIPWRLTPTVSPQGHCYLALSTMNEKHPSDVSITTTSTPSSSARRSSSEVMEWIKRDAGAESTTSTQKLFEQGEEQKLRLLQINYHPVRVHPPSPLAAAAIKKQKQKKGVKLLEKEKNAWKAHETNLENLLSDVRTRLHEQTTIALELLIEKTGKRRASTVAEKVEERTTLSTHTTSNASSTTSSGAGGACAAEKGEEASAEVEQAPLSEIGSTSPSPLTESASALPSTADVAENHEEVKQGEKAGEIQKEEEQQEEEAMDQKEEEEEERVRVEDGPWTSERDEEALLISDIPEDVEEDMLGRGGEEGVVHATPALEGEEELIKQVMNQYETKKNKEEEGEKMKKTKTDEVEEESMERGIKEKTAEFPKYTAVVEGLQSLGELAGEVALTTTTRKNNKNIKKKDAREKQKDKENKNKKKQYEPASFTGETKEEEEEEKIFGAPKNEEEESLEMEAGVQQEQEEVGEMETASLLSSPSTLVFSNDVELKDLRENVVEFSRQHVEVPWKLNVSFTKGEVCITKLPPIPPNALNHPFCKALQTDKDGNVRWVIEAVNGKSLVDVPHSLKRQALETIKKSTSVSFMLRGLRRV